ncbi:MAG: dTDP-4-amino-4,6-dideoxygalactose transaminase [Algoriphagus sp.]|jgi:dTDP-4-amino-4,6-dideoxygalactose transaminase
MHFALPLSSPVFDGNEKIYSERAIGSGHISTFGGFITKFEQKLSKRLKTHDAVALNSGTSALHLAMAILGVEAGDEVICQSFTFCASATPIIYLGATPIFVDSELDSWNMSPEILEDAILGRIAKGKKPKAIVIVHLFGMPAKIEAVLEIATKYEIPVIEDAAEAVGSTYNNVNCGAFGNIGIYSFNGNKIITTGGGGVLLSSNTAIIQRARYLSTQAREDLPYYQHLEIGFNYKMNNLSASIGLAQLEQLDEFVRRRRKINTNYKKLLGSFEGITFQEDSENSRSNFWLTALLIDDKITGFTNDRIRLVLREKGIESRFLWKPLHMQPVFSGIPFYGGNKAEKMFKKGLCLPSSVNLTHNDQQKIVDVIAQELIKAS